MNKAKFTLLTGILFTAITANALTITSTAFNNNAAIPSIYTCTGQDINPPLTWTDLPAKTQTLTLILSDPDAPSGTWYHWSIINLPPTTTTLSENLQTLPKGAGQGDNSWKLAKYRGPCPPSGEHRYIFRLYALDTRLNLPAGTTSEQILDALRGHVIATAELTGRYRKQ